MSYQLPTLEELQTLANTLEDNYTGTNNKERRNFIDFIKKLVAEPTLLAHEDAAKILMGAYVFEMEVIENSYRALSQKRSRMFVLLEHGLKITKENNLQHEKKLVYLAAFYNYIRHQAPKELLEETTWVEKEALQRPIVNSLRFLLAKQYDKVDCVLSRLPTYESLCKNFEGMSGRYDKVSKAGWLFAGKTHAPLAKFIDFINEYCDRFLPVMSANHLDPALECQESYILRMAAVIYVMKCIEDTYLCRSGTSSNLHNMCGNGIKGKNGITTRDINVDEKIAWLAALASHIKSMLENRKEFIKEKEDAGDKRIQAELTEILGKIWRNLGALTAERDAPSRIQGHMTMATSGVAQYGMNAFIQNAVGAGLPGPAGALMDSAAGITGFAVLGPGGAVLGSTISRLVRSNLIPMAAAGIFSGVLDRVGTTVGAGITGIVILPFSITARGLQALVDLCKGPGFDKSMLLKDEEYIKALMSLPDDVFAPDKKAVIETTFGFKPTTLC